MSSAPRTRSLEKLFRPRSIAIVGASETGGEGFSRLIFQNHRETGFPSKLYLVNPTRQTLWDRNCYPDLEALPEPVDLALIMVAAERVDDVVRQAAETGAGAAVVFASRIGEGDETARNRAVSLGQTADEAGVTLCGPNCLGVMAFAEGLYNYPSADIRKLPAGKIGVAFQSGGTLRYWMRRGAERGLGFSYAVSTGNEIQTDLADYIDFFVGDASTRIIACLSEGIRRPQQFFAAARRALEAGKPIVMLKTGRTEQSRQSAASHVGAISGDDEVFDAVCERYGILRCDTLDDMIETCVALSADRLPKGNRIAVSGFTGLGRSLLFDYCAATDLQFAEFSSETVESVQPRIDRGLEVTNPLDAGAGLAVRQSDFRDVSIMLARDPNVDMVLIQGRLPQSVAEKGEPGVYASIARATDKPIFAYDRMTQNTDDLALDFQKDAEIPFLQRLPESLRALDLLAKFGKKKMEPLPEVLPEAVAGGEPVSAQDLIAASGIREPAQIFCTSLDEVAEAARQIGEKVAIKLVSPDALHKTEVGGVRINVKADEATAVAGQMRDRFVQVRPDARLDGFLLQEMVEGLEMILGVREDPIYGPLLILGMGGIFVEIYKDVGRCLLPVVEADVHRILDNLAGRELLSGFRGGPVRDRDAVVAAAMALGDAFLAARGRLGDVEINPLIVREKGQGVRAVDVRVTR